MSCDYASAIWLVPHDLLRGDTEVRPFWPDPFSRGALGGSGHETKPYMYMYMYTD